MRNTSKSNSLANKAYTIVRHRILRGEIAMGEVISRRTLASELGMSMLPVLEALVRLEVEGLLESRPRAGTRVRIPTPEDVLGHFIVREALESQAAQLFVKEASRSERAALMKLAAGVDATSQEDRVHYVGIHYRFHHRIAECTHCPELCRAIDSTQALSSTWLCVLYPRLPHHSLRQQDHQELMRVLVKGTAEEAAQKMREHVMLGCRQIMDGLEPYFKLRKINGETYARSAKKRLQAPPLDAVVSAVS